MMYILEARAILKASPDSPALRATLTFPIKVDDDDVKLCLDNPVVAPSRAPRAGRYEPYPATPRQRSEPRPKPPTTKSHGSRVPSRLRELENVCYEWCKAGMPELNGSTQCPRVAAGQAKCD